MRSAETEDGPTENFSPARPALAREGGGPWIPPLPPARGRPGKQPSPPCSRRLPAARREGFTYVPFNREVGGSLGLFESARRGRGDGLGLLSRASAHPEVGDGTTASVCSSPPGTHTTGLRGTVLAPRNASGLLRKFKRLSLAADGVAPPPHGCRLPIYE